MKFLRDCTARGIRLAAHHQPVIRTQPDNFNRMLGFTAAEATHETTWLDPQMKAVHADLRRRFPGQSVSIRGYNDGLPRILFVTHAIIHPHGGPWARDFAGWDATGRAPFLTSRGYAVLRPNGRGSEGLGRVHWIAGDGQWVQTMQDDEDDGAAWLVAQASPTRTALRSSATHRVASRQRSRARTARTSAPIAGAPLTDLARVGMRWSDRRAALGPRVPSASKRLAQLGPRVHPCDTGPAGTDRHARGKTGSPSWTARAAALSQQRQHRIQFRKP